jgi:8-oxo-dGTP pyrophosphatase MutT (NUDIX family)
MYNPFMPEEIFHAAGLISLLKEYHPIDKADAENQTALLKFVSSHSDCHKRSLLIGHVTGSAWIIDRAQSQVLLTHHANLDRWMQLGGHVEDDPSIESAALREAQEESGLSSIVLATGQIFDLDIHEIPQSPKAAAHLHYDVRFLFNADPTEPLQISSESKNLKWVLIDEVSTLTSERSVLRMVEKTKALHGLP